MYIYVQILMRGPDEKEVETEEGAGPECGQEREVFRDDNWWEVMLDRVARVSLAVNTGTDLDQDWEAEEEEQEGGEEVQRVEEIEKKQYQTRKKLKNVNGKQNDFKKGENDSSSDEECSTWDKEDQNEREEEDEEEGEVIDDGVEEDMFEEGEEEMTAVRARLDKTEESLARLSGQVGEMTSMVSLQSQLLTSILEETKRNRVENRGDKETDSHKN